MFERFTDRARRLLVLAQEETITLGHDYLMPEHMIIGAVREGGGIAAVALTSAGLDVDSLRAAVTDRFPAREPVDAVGALAAIGIEVSKVVAKAKEAFGEGALSVPKSPPFNDGAKKALELSLREALDLKHTYIGTEHILLALTHVEVGGVREILRGLGVAPDELRSRVVRFLDEFRNRDVSVGAADLRYAAGLLQDEIGKEARAIIAEVIDPAHAEVLAGLWRIEGDWTPDDVHNSIQPLREAVAATRTRLDEVGFLGFVDRALELRNSSAVLAMTDAMKSLAQRHSGDADLMVRFARAQREASDIYTAAWREAWERRAEPAAALVPLFDSAAARINQIAPD